MFKLCDINLTRLTIAESSFFCRKKMYDIKGYQSFLSFLIRIPITLNNPIEMHKFTNPLFCMT